MLVLAGCPKSAPPESLDYSAPAHLPAVSSGSYGRLQRTPPDPVLQSVLKDHRWDAYLSGASSALALTAASQDWALAGWEVRESAWRAGYVYPVIDIQGFAAQRDAPPPPDLLSWLDQVPGSVDLGLVRAHGSKRDAWVGLVGKPRIDLGIMPRRVDLGDELRLPEVADFTYRIADADGTLREGPLDRGFSITTSIEGEWLVQVVDKEGIAAMFPVYVGMDPPIENLLPPHPKSLRDPETGRDHLVELLTMVRDTYDLGMWQSDKALDRLAGELLARAPKDATAYALDSGSVEEPLKVWSCTAPYIEACVDALVWDPRQRYALISGDFRAFGAAVAVEADKVRIRVVLTGD